MVLWDIGIINGKNGHIKLGKCTEYGSTEYGSLGHWFPCFPLPNQKRNKFGCFCSFFSPAISLPFSFFPEKSSITDRINCSANGKFGYFMSHPKHVKTSIKTCVPPELVVKWFCRPIYFMVIG